MQYYVLSWIFKRYMTSDYSLVHWLFDCIQKDTFLRSLQTWCFARQTRIYEILRKSLSSGQNAVHWSQCTALWPYSNPWITQAYYYPTNNIISNPSTKQEDSIRNRAQAKQTLCSKRPLTPNPRIPHQQVSSASDCIKTPHRHSHTETERQHTPNQVCGSADTIFLRHYHNMLHNTLYHHKTPCQPYYRNHTLLHNHTHQDQQRPNK